jgi:predicted sugar kinase
MVLLKLHPAVVHASIEDLIAAVRELQDISRDLALQTQQLAETLRDGQ